MNKVVQIRKNQSNQLVDTWIKRFGIATLAFIIYNVVIVIFR